MKKQMKIEEAILYCLASQNRGMRTEQIAEMINRQRLHIRKDGQPVTSNQVYAVICRYPDMFVKEKDELCWWYKKDGYVADEFNSPTLILSRMVGLYPICP